jgi:hypothetical protein
MTRRAPEPDPDLPDLPDLPAAPADVPPGTAPPVRSAEGTSEALPPVGGVHAPDCDEPS